jgi:hypothetical protein
VFTVPLTAPFAGVTEASQVPFVSLTVQELRATFALPCLIVTVLQAPVFVVVPLFAVSA